MQPEQPNSNPYDFIFNAPEQPKQSRFPVPRGNSIKSRVLLVVGGIVALIVVVILVLSLLGSGDKANANRLLEIAQTQTEIIRIADGARTKARSKAALNLATNVSATISSSQQAIIPLVKDAGLKTDTKQLALKQNSSTDKTLQAASENGQYDQAFQEEIMKEVTAYKQLLKDTYQISTKEKQKNVLNTAYENAATLLSED